MKVSKNKEKIINVLKKINKPANVQQIYKALNEEKKVNLSTVYRCINSLCEENVILKEIRNDKNSYYTLNTSSHIHQLVCDICNDTVLINECPITKISEQIKSETGFYITNHSIQLNGICKSCSKNNINKMSRNL